MTNRYNHFVANNAAREREELDMLAAGDDLTRAEALELEMLDEEFDNMFEAYEEEERFDYDAYYYDRYEDEYDRDPYGDDYNDFDDYRAGHYEYDDRYVAPEVEPVAEYEAGYTLDDILERIMKRKLFDPQIDAWYFAA